MPSALVLARTTMTAAFQRMYARMRRSMCSSPGNHGSCSRGMLLTYGVETVAGKLTCDSRARSSSRDNKYLARVLPCTSTTASSESSHSAVSPGSVSGNWCIEPSKIMGSFSQTYWWVPAERLQISKYLGRDCYLHRRSMFGKPRPWWLGVGNISNR